MANAIRNAAVAATLAAAGLTGAYNLIDTFEGNRNTVYLDPLGIKTICRGTTSGPLIAKGKATDAECDAATLKDIEVAAATVRRCFTGHLTVGEYSAWTSFTYNVGPGGKGVKDGFCKLKNGNEPTLLKLLKRGDDTATRRAACAQLYDWAMPGTNVYNGLLKRRTSEYAMCVRDLDRLEGKP